MSRAPQTETDAAMTEMLRQPHHVVSECQFARIITYREALRGLAALAHDGSLSTHAADADITRGDLAALFTLLGDHIESIAYDLPKTGWGKAN